MVLKTRPGGLRGWKHLMSKSTSGQASSNQICNFMPVFRLVTHYSSSLLLYVAQFLAVVVSFASLSSRHGGEVENPPIRPAASTKPRTTITTSPFLWGLGSGDVRGKTACTYLSTGGRTEVPLLQRSANVVWCLGMRGGGGIWCFDIANIKS